MLLSDDDDDDDDDGNLNGLSLFSLCKLFIPFLLTSSDVGIVVRNADGIEHTFDNANASESLLFLSSVS